LNDHDVSILASIEFGTFRLTIAAAPDTAGFDIVDFRFLGLTIFRVLDCSLRMHIEALPSQLRLESCAAPSDATHH
jgi:hypothetical protein